MIYHPCEYFVTPIEMTIARSLAMCRNGLTREEMQYCVLHFQVVLEEYLGCEIAL